MKLWMVSPNAIGVAIVLSTLFTLFASMGLQAGGRVGEEIMIEQEVMELMKSLDTMDEQARMRLVSKVDEQRSELLSVLIKHLDASSSKNVQAAAIYLIGRHRLAEGVGELIRRIDFDASGQAAKGAEPLWEQYPAMEALVTIGKPSVRAALQLLAIEKDNLRRTLAVKVIRYVEGAEVAHFILDHSCAIENDAIRKANLADARARLAKLPR